MRKRCGRVAAGVLWMLVGASPVLGETIEELRGELDHLLERARELERRIERLEQGEAAPDAVDADADAALDAALEEARQERARQETARREAVTEAPPAAPAIAARRVGGATLSLLDVSVDVIAAAGFSDERDDVTELLQAGAHDPKRRGFTLQQAEISLTGAVDPYFTAEVHVIATDEEIELEEALLTTTSLPWGLEVEAGHFLTEFGRINPRHPHAWDWVDQPVIVSRLLGGEGLRNPGARIAWLMPLPFFAEVHLGAQNASGDTARSFFGSGEEEEGFGPVGGFEGDEDDVRRVDDLLYLTRVVSGFDVGESLSALVGGSALFGPNAVDGRTYVWGSDVTVKWRPPRNFRGWPFLVWQSEVMGRIYEMDELLDPAGLILRPGRTLHDRGLYSQLLWGFRYGWAGGVRYEWAGGSGQSVGGRSNDPARADRHRVSPLLAWHPSEFSRLRLQYNYDDMDLLSGNAAHAVWLSLEVGYGAHPAHSY